MLAFAIALALCQDVPAAPIAEHNWGSVPVFVVPEVAIENGSWKAVDGWKRTGEDLRVEATFEPDHLQLLVTNYKGLWGDSLYFRFRVTPDGRLEADARSTWNTDVTFAGHKPYGPNVDLHGQVLVEARAAGSPAPLRCSFRLNGIKVGFGKAVPMVTEGEIEAPLDSRWSPAIASPARPEHPELVLDEELEEISWKWPDGTPRSHGWIDSKGLRQRLWTTWYSDGTKQSESEFRHGERHGKWAGYMANGPLCEKGEFQHGVRQGRWLEHEAHEDQMTTKSGTYTDGQKEGQWTERWEDGSLRAQGLFLKGEESGPWTRWWPNGNKLCEGRYEDGYQVGEWRFWYEDGSLRSVETKRKPPWARR